ncbi:hypothetical protein GNF76_13215 [Pseudomonas sp. CCM 7893]|uniref:Uncharacterized protein n=1 Tax=Pseudomonas spelaei TaxID=1055469 RepID=A0A6I3WFG8_9PSED|nr:hypothetical protein [Pseudomonas spelaei]MUF05306.1 hypothetical protein [Pseudomonas spelaei]
MAHPSITDASSITANVILDVGKYYSAQQLRTVQAKLSGAVREIRYLTGGNTLPGRIGAQLNLEQRQLLQDAAKLIESVNTNIKHAKEKRSRTEEHAKRRQQARYAEAKRVVAETYPLPCETLAQLLDVLKTLLTFNRAGVLNNGYSPQGFNVRLREYLSPSYIRKLIGWPSPQAFWKSTAYSLRNEFLLTMEHEISYDDGSSILERLYAVEQKVANCQSSVYLCADEEETLRLWSQALAPSELGSGR